MPFIKVLPFLTDGFGSAILMHRLMIELCSSILLVNLAISQVGKSMSFGKLGVKFIVLAILFS